MTINHQPPRQHLIKISLLRNILSLPETLNKQKKRR